jgi:mRNA interferase MazF
MQRSELWVLRDDGYASKARPVVIIQSNLVDTFDSVILCLLTTYDNSDAQTRVKIEPSIENGLQRTSFVMTEKLVTVDKALLDKKIGVLSASQMHAISHQLARILVITAEDI